MRDRRSSFGATGTAAAVLIAAVFGVGTVPTGAAAASCPSDGAGTSGDPYRITSEADFALITGCGLGNHYVQTKDLELGNVTPIGAVSSSFTGSYRGVVSATDLTPHASRSLSIAIEAPGSPIAVGLFAFTNGASITHLTLSGTLETDGLVAGGLIGRALKGLTVTDVTSSVSVTGGNNSAGGLIGQMFSDDTVVEIRRVIVSGSVRPAGPATGASGGLIGEVNATFGSGEITIEDVAIGGAVGERTEGATVARFDRSGGLAGAVNSANLVLTGGITVGTSDAPVRIAGDQFAGGLIGELRVPSAGTTIGPHAVHADVDTPAAPSGSAAGGVLGQVLRGSGPGSLTITGPTHLTGSVSVGPGGQSRAGGAIGFASNIGPMTLQGIMVDSAIEALNGYAGGMVGFVSGVSSLSIGGDGHGEAVEVDGSIVGGDFDVGGFVGSASGLGADPDEGGLRITGSRMSASVTSNSSRGTGGAVGVVAGSAAWTLRLKDVEVGSDAVSGRATIRVDRVASSPMRSYVGGMIGRASGPVTVDITGGHAFVDIGPVGGAELAEVGGVIGGLLTTTSSSIRGVEVGGSVDGHFHTGGVIGFVGHNGPTVAHAIGPDGGTPTTITASIGGRNDTTGGVVGQVVNDVDLTIDGVVMSGEVTSTASAGGIVGLAQSALLTITDTTMSGDVLGVRTAAGFIASAPDADGISITVDGGAFSGTAVATAEHSFSELRVAGFVADTDRLITVSGAPTSTGTLRAVHPDGSSDGAVFLTGGVLVSTFASDPGGVDPATADLTAFSGLGTPTFDISQVAPAILEAGRCVVSTGATVSRWRDTSTGGAVLEIRRVDPPVPDPCPEPSDGFGFRFENDDDDDGHGDDDVAGTSGITASGIAVDCVPGLLQVGTTVGCTIVGGPSDLDVVWRAAVNPTIASGIIRTGADGRAAFAFEVPTDALGRAITVELVDWTAPMLLGTVAGPVPGGIPAGDGVSVLTAGGAVRHTSPHDLSGPAGIARLAVLAAALALTARRRSRRVISGVATPFPALRVKE